jgi:ABC-2 type transport system ATP-binding protein
MWALVRQLRDQGVTIILTTHYIEEAEDMADRVGVIDKGRLILVEDKNALMKKLGKKHLTLQLRAALMAIPPELASWSLALKANGYELEYTYDAKVASNDIASLLQRLTALGIGFTDLHTQQSSLEDIFVSLVSDKSQGQP